MKASPKAKFGKTWQPAPRHGGPRPPSTPPPLQQRQEWDEEGGADAEEGENAEQQVDAEGEEQDWGQDEGDWNKEQDWNEEGAQDQEWQNDGEEEFWEVSRPWQKEEKWTAEQWKRWNAKSSLNKRFAFKRQGQKWTDEEWKEWEAQQEGADQDDDQEAEGTTHVGKGRGRGRGRVLVSAFGGRGTKRKQEEEEDADWGDGRKRRKGKGKGKDRKKGKGKGKKTNFSDPWESQNPPDKIGDNWEELREDTGLKLIKDLAPKTARWVYPVMDESRRCFAGSLPCPFTDKQCKVWFEKVKNGTNWLQLQGTNGPMPRKTAWLVKQGCTCDYRYGSTVTPPEVYPPYMVELLRAAMPLCGLQQSGWPDACNLNLYDDGNHSVGWHSDDEKLFQGKFQDIRIISLSFGQQRTFEVRTNWPEEREQRTRVKKIPIKSGDLMTMEGMFQKHYQHRVPKENIRHCQARINLTWRWVLKHDPSCPQSRGRR